MKKTVKKHVFRHTSDNIYDGLGIDPIKVLGVFSLYLKHREYDKKSKAAETILKLHNKGVLNVVECMWLYHHFVYKFYTEYES